MKTKAAVLFDVHQPFEVVELDLEGPREGEVLLRYVASGLCHSDLHMVDGESNPRFPIVPGHEGSAIVEEVGPGVRRVKPGDHVVCSFVPSCGVCRYCSTGHHNLCNRAANIRVGSQPDGTYRRRYNGVDVGAGCMVGTFAEWGTVAEESVVVIDPWLPLETAALVGCAVCTGWGTAVNTGGVRAGDAVVVFGSGGIGSNAVQGAAHAGARYLIVVDPVPFKRDMAMKLGATHAFAEPAEAAATLNELTWGQGADEVLVTVGTPDADTISAAFDMVGKGGTLVLTGLAHPDTRNIILSGSSLTLWEKTIKGSVFGSANPQYDIVRLLRLYHEGKLKLDELITNTYSLEQINQGYEDLRNGLNIRGLITHTRKDSQ